MTDDEARDILLESDWAKFSDAQSLIQDVWQMGYNRHKLEVTNQSERIAALEAALEQARETLDRVRVFVMTREKIKHPEGTEWFNASITALDKTLGEKP